MAEFLRSDISNVDDYVADRGPARYFHGRKRVLDNFDKLVKESMEAQGGSTFLIQGAPGAGKTALLEEIAIDALGNQWNVFEINLGDLYNPAQMAQTLGKPYVSRKQTAIKADAKVLATERIKEVAGDSSVSRVLEKMNPSQGVLLILDEAQRIAGFAGSPHTIAVMDILDNLHNGKFNHPTILLVAGLGRTKTAFRSLGISRFKGGCFVELGALGKEAERAVIRDWLIKEGGAKGDPTTWIDAIAQKTHGWPQHITAYADAAVKQVKINHGEMTPEGLEVVYQSGMERREAYYHQRAEEISRKERCSLARLVKNVSIGDGLDKEDIEAALSQEYGPEKAQDLFTRVLDRGILHSYDGVYTVPIPSMHNWLVSNYGREEISFPYAPQTRPAFREQDPGRER
ncbi:MAG: ATP-binding protein [Rhodothermaceae bacterium]|nr:ATP-binding protein [Bacteroidota bacterium]MXW13603.1 ATP-binding protein [Rhodothermaceae bacterium]MXW31800.1 ATP-binding protein [Rhodothermaceae bacterium]MYC03325.1 ATP-binding protein [Rhodothermaceae bacterium]MYE62978.1 ATP-binding protein [Rhodothermaceae bacterium]